MNKMELNKPMAAHNFSDRSNNLVLCRQPGFRHYLVFSLISLFFVFPFNTATANEGVSSHPVDSELMVESSKLTFLPLKVFDTKEPDVFFDLVNNALKDVLAVHAIDLVSMEKAAVLLPPPMAWPLNKEEAKPLFSVLQSRFIASGSVTRAGEAISVDLSILDSRGVPSVGYFFDISESDAELPAMLARLLDKILAFTDRTSTIATIGIKGNERVDSGAILRYIQSRKGDRINNKKLAQDLKEIFKMGFFEDVRIDSTSTPEGLVITFLVKEKPLIHEIVIKGNDKLEEEAVLEVLTVQKSSIVNANEVRKSIQNIRQLYKEKGYYNTKVVAKLSYPDTGKVKIRFVIKEGKKIFVKKIDLIGNESFSDRKIKKLMVLKEKGLLSFITDAGLLKLGMLEHDAARINAFYHNNGFIEAKVSKPKVVAQEEWLFVSINIAEGPRYTVGAVDVTGDLIVDKDELLKKLKILDEKFMNRKMIREDVLRITDFYAEKGFAFAEVHPRIESNPENKEVRLNFKITKGSLVSINRIIIKGNTDTRDKVIRRRMVIKEKGLFNTKALKMSKARIQRLGFFEDVTITPEPTLEDDKMDIIVRIKEQPTGSFSIGAGYSSAESLLFQAEITKNNFLGRGQKLSFKGKTSGYTTRYNINFTEPAFLDTKLLTGIDLFDWKRRYDDYTKDSQGFSIRFGYPIWERWTMYWSYGYDSTGLQDVSDTTSKEILASEGVTNSVKLGFGRDTRNRGYDANVGSKYSIRFKYAGKPLGGDFAFSSVEADSSWFFTGDKFLFHPFFKPTTFHFKLAAGYVQRNSGGKLPVYEKYYLGGINTIRGFDLGRISPKDPLTGERVGGDKMWYTNLEYIFPLIADAGLKGVLFFDAGNVYGVGKGWQFRKWVRASTGVGFRWLSPMGPLRLEWGYNLDPEDDEDQSNWDFTIGGLF